MDRLDYFVAEYHGEHEFRRMVELRDFENKQREKSLPELEEYLLEYEGKYFSKSSFDRFKCVFFCSDELDRYNVTRRVAKEMLKTELNEGTYECSFSSLQPYELNLVDRVLLGTPYKNISIQLRENILN